MGNFGRLGAFQETQDMAPGTASPPPEKLQKLVTLYQAGHMQRVLDLGLRLLARHPDDLTLLNLVGAASMGVGDLERAISSFSRTVELVPGVADAYTNLGAACNAAGRNDQALEYYQKAINLAPGDGANYYNLGNALRDLGDQEQALGAYLRAVELSPGQVNGFNNLGICLVRLGRLREACDSFRKAIELDPGFADAHMNLGNALRSLHRYDEATNFYRRAIKLRPDYAEAHNNLGQVYNLRGETESAIAAYSRAAQLAPAVKKYRANLIFQRARLCEWVKSDLEAIPFSAPDSAQDAIDPFVLMHLQDDPRVLRRCAELFAENYGGVKELPRTAEPAADVKPLHIGYFSADFHNHPVMQLLIRTLELMDREVFVQHAFSFGPNSDDELRHRLVNAVDKFHEVRGLGDRDVAELAHREGIDIAIDLTGYTRNSRCGIFAYRAAPVQINYLGYPGTSGAPWMDYILADNVVIPEDQAAHYAESVIYLPISYMPSDDTHNISPNMPSRAAEGLPEDGFVYCCFNKANKIRPQEFDIWMRLLGQTEGSVLWLKLTSEKARKNLRIEAQRRGINPDRLVFASHAERLEDHLARHSLADLFLDTFNHNAHTTAMDALWSGLPILTRAGQGFASRVTASLLNALDLPELITRSDKAYEETALELARDSEKLAALKSKLAVSRQQLTLFKPIEFARHLGRALELAHKRHLEGLPPGTFRV